MNNTWKEEDFEIIKKLGQGVFAIVYLAVEKLSGKNVALKKIQKSFITQHKQEFRLRREVEIHSHLNYIHITKMYGYFKSDKFIYLVLEFCKDGTLYEKLIKENELSDSFIKKIAF